MRNLSKKLICARRQKSFNRTKLWNVNLIRWWCSVPTPTMRPTTQNAFSLATDVAARFQQTHVGECNRNREILE